MRIWLHQGHDGDDGFEAWCLDLVGFATYAPTREEVLRRVPGKLDEHLLWLTLHGLPAPQPPSGIDVVEEIRGNELMFRADRERASVEEIDLTLELLATTRADLFREIGDLPDQVLDWDPPYHRFAEWATWRTIRQIVAHIANSETHYYGRHIGMRAATARVDPPDDFRAYLPRTRMQTVMFLQTLKASPDRNRMTENGEHWSVRKALRRMVRHEIMHTRSIRRIAGEYQLRS